MTQKIRIQDGKAFHREGVCFFNEDEKDSTEYRECEQCKDIHPVATSDTIEGMNGTYCKYCHKEITDDLRRYYHEESLYDGEIDFLRGNDEY